ncbi:MAG: hypothetical protein ACLUOI_09890 [Eisenbergiella sp.]
MDAEISGTVSKEVIGRKVLELMKKILSEKKLDYVQFYINFVDEILPDPRTGKKALVIRKGEGRQDETCDIAG